MIGKGILVDSYAWVEVINGTKKGKRVLDILSKVDGEFYTTAINIAEVLRALYKQGKEMEAKKAREVMATAGLISIDEAVAELAAKISVKKHLGLADALITASAINANLTVLTGDVHFKNLDIIEVIML